MSLNSQTIIMQAPEEKENNFLALLHLMENKLRGRRKKLFSLQKINLLQAHSLIFRSKIST